MAFTSISGWQWDDLDQGVAECDEVDGPEPHRGRAQQHGDGGGPGRERDHRVPGVPRDDEEVRGQRPGGGAQVASFIDWIFSLFHHSLYVLCMYLPETVEQNLDN